MGLSREVLNIIQIALCRYSQDVVVEANLHDKLQADYPAAISASKERARIKKALSEVERELKQQVEDEINAKNVIGTLQKMITITINTAAFEEELRIKKEQKERATNAKPS